MIGLITRNLTKFSRPCSHFGIIFAQEDGKRGIPVYQTWHIVKSITLYHFTSHSISELHLYTYSLTPYMYIRQLFWPLCISAFYPRFSVLSPFWRFIPNSAFYPHFSVLSPFQCFIPISALYPHFSVLSPFQRFILISVFYPHFSVVSPSQRFIPISVFYPHFSVVSPFQCFIPISAFYSHFSVLFPFQCFIPTRYGSQYSLA